LEQCIGELESQRELSKKLEEELTITAHNYESQLSSMSEHMANQNDKITAQEVAIEDLSYQLSLNSVRIYIFFWHGRYLIMILQEPNY